MKKAIGFILISLIALSNKPLGADQTRLSAIGPAAVFTVDDSDPWIYPAEVNNYSRLLAWELDTFPFDGKRVSFLASWADNEQKYGTWGLGQGILPDQKLLENLVSSLNSALRTNPLMSPRNDIPRPENSYHFFYAKDFGQLTSGLHLARSSSDKTRDYSDTIPEDAVNRRSDIGIWAFEAGASAIVGDNIYIQSGIGYQTISFSSRFELSGASPLYWEQVDNEGSRALSMRARLFYGLTDKLKIVPIISYNALSLGYLASYGDTVHMPGSLYDGTGSSYSQREVNGAIGAEYRPHKDITLLGGVSLIYRRTEISDSNNVWLLTANPARRYLSQEKTIVVLPGFQLGAETELLKWLKFRIGAFQRPSKTTTRSEFKNGLTTETSESHSEFNIYFGFGFEFGKLTIDAQLDGGQPYSAGYLFSGTPNVPFTKLSLKYGY